MKKFNFTKESIMQLEKPANKMDYYQDTKEKGLSLYITSHGYITFFIRKAIERKDKRIIIGKFPEVSVAKAREIAFRIKSQIITGDIQQKPSNVVTFKKIFEEYMERHAKKEKRSWKEDGERKIENMKLRFKDSPFVFPGKCKTGHLVEPKKTWYRILKELNIKDFRLHDLRRTFGSWQAISGSSSLIIGKSLGHKANQQQRFMLVFQLIL